MTQDSLFSDDEIEQLETPESRAGKAANAVFRRWYVQWYEGRYTQNQGHIAKVFKDAVMKGVDPYDLEWAANILGEEEQVVTEASLQFALSRVRKYKIASGMSDSTHPDEKEYSENI